MHVLSLVLLLAVSKLASAAPTPLFGLDLGEININTDGETSDAGTVSVSQEDITSTLVRPALFARVAYCSSPSVLNMTCGEQCDALPNVKILVAGGDDGLVPNFFVAHDVDTDTIVVAHQGTEPKNLLSDLNDLNFLQVDANTTVLPKANSKLAASCLTWSWVLISDLQRTSRCTTGSQTRKRGQPNSSCPPCSPH